MDIQDEEEFCSGCESPLPQGERCAYCFCYECGAEKQWWDRIYLKENWLEANEKCQECCEEIERRTEPGLSWYEASLAAADQDEFEGRWVSR